MKNKTTLRYVSFLLAAIVILTGFPIGTLAQNDMWVSQSDMVTEPIDAPQTDEEEENADAAIPVSEQSTDEIEQADLAAQESTVTEDASLADIQIAPQNTAGPVTSSDGRVTLQDFTAKWIATDLNTVDGDTLTARVPYDKTSPYVAAQMQLDWSMSGQGERAPGDIAIEVPAMVDMDHREHGNLYSTISMPKAVIGDDGLIDFTADYGIADYIWYESEGKYIIVNRVAMPAANQGTATITYQATYKDTNIRDSAPLHMRDLHLSLPIATRAMVKASPTETLEVQAPDLYVRANTEIYELGLYHYQSAYASWTEASNAVLQDNRLGDLVPEAELGPNPDDYLYILYRMEGRFRANQETQWELVDTLDPRLTPIRAWEEPSKNVMNEIPVTANGFSNTQDFSIYGLGYSAGYHVLLARIPKSELVEGQTYRFTNRITATLSPLYPGGDDAPKTATSTVVTTYSIKPFSAPPGDHSVVKGPDIPPRTTPTSGLGGFVPPTRDPMYRAHDGVWVMPRYGLMDGILADKPVEVEWHMSGVVDGFLYTYDPVKGNPDEYTAYGHLPYTASVADDYTYLSDTYGEELTSQDYQIKEIEITDSFEYHKYKETTSGWRYARVSGEDEKLNTPTETTAAIYGRKAASSEWVLLGNITNPTVSVSQMNIEPTIPGVTTNGRFVTLPPGYVSAKVDITTSHHAIEMRYKVVAELLPSERVKSAMLGYLERNETGRLQNDGTLIVTDHTGAIRAIPNTEPETENTRRTLELDRANYGQEMYHSPAYYEFMPTVKEPHLGKASFAQTPIHGEEQTINILYIVQGGQLVDGYLGEGDELTGGTFYDLLPPGVNVDPKTILIFTESYANIQVFPYGSIQNARMRELGFTNYQPLHNKPIHNVESLNVFNGGFNPKPHPPFTYEIIENYKGSGRSLLKVHVEDLEYSGSFGVGKKNQYVTLFFVGAYDVNNYKDLGPNINNIVAFEGSNEKLGNEAGSLGYPDDPEEYDGFAETEKTIMRDLNPDHDNPSFAYTRHDRTLVADSISTTGLSKRVRDSQDPSWSVETETTEDGIYQYRLRLQSLTGTRTSNIVLFDSLENYDPLPADSKYGEPQWQGTFDSIDLTHADLLGINAVVYYSTVEGLDIRANQDVSDQAVWSTTMPDKEDIKAIAVDLSKTNQGTDFVLEEHEGIQVTLNMRAPYGATGYALNDVFASTTLETATETETRLIHNPYTAVYLEALSVEHVIEATKRLLNAKDEEKELLDGQFAFVLKDSDGNTLQTKGNAVDGKIVFDPITYSLMDVGEHTYTINEVIGDNERILYDDHVETVTIRVERTESGDLTATASYDEDGAIFTNREIGAAQIQLIKYNEDKTLALEGAEYAMYHADDTPYVDDEGNPVILITGADGHSQIIEGIDVGHYYLIETKVPDGYLLSDEPIAFEITEDDLNTLITIVATDRMIEILPATGGEGIGKVVLMTTILGFMGLALTLEAKRRKTRLNR